MMYPRFFEPSLSFFYLVLLIGLISVGAGCENETANNTIEPESTQPVSVQTYQSRGVVKSIVPSKTFVNVDHEEIPGYMDAMTMFFAVADTMELQDVLVSDSISFTLVVERDRTYLTDVDVLGR